MSGLRCDLCARPAGGLNKTEVGDICTPCYAIWARRMIEDFKNQVKFYDQTILELSTIINNLTDLIAVLRKKD